MKFQEPIFVDISPALTIAFQGVTMDPDKKTMAFDYRIVEKGVSLPENYQDLIKEFLCSRMDDFLDKIKE